MGAPIGVGCLAFSYPARRRWDPTWSDMIQLAQTLYHSDVLVNVASTISLDAAYLDKPIVCVAFDGNDRRKSYFESCRRIYDFTCWQNVVRCGGVRIATTRDEVVHWINVYFDNPSWNSEGRRRIKQEQAYFYDGRSAQRMAKIVLRELNVSGDAVVTDPKSPSQPGRISPSYVCLGCLTGLNLDRKFPTDRWRAVRRFKR